MNKLLIITGPTATGKTDLAIQMAKKYNGELISCDSRQVYIGLDIGTGKLPGGNEHQIKKNLGSWEIDGVTIWLYDLVKPEVQFSVSDYVEQAKNRIEQITSQDKLPIIVGGTGHYLKGLLEGFENLGKPNNPELRKELNNLTVEELQKKMLTLSPSRISKMNDSDRQNPRRLIRAIEIALNKNNQPKTNQINWDDYSILKIGLSAPRPFLNQRIDQRVISRIGQGMITEAEQLRKNGLTLERMKELGLEYRYLAELLKEDLSKDQFIKTLQIKIHQYAKRQLTYLKRQTFGPREINWFDISILNWSAELDKKVHNWYH